MLYGLLRTSKSTLKIQVMDNPEVNKCKFYAALFLNWICVNTKY